MKEIFAENTNENAKEENAKTISIFLPLSIKKRGNGTLILMPRNGEVEDLTDNPKHFNHLIIRSIAKAYKWKIMLEEKHVSSLAEIAQKEKLTPSYVSRIFNLNFLSPKIVESFLSGTQPRKFKLKNFIMVKIPDSWQEQEKYWGFR